MVTEHTGPVEVVNDDTTKLIGVSPARWVERVLIIDKTAKAKLLIHVTCGADHTMVVQVVDV